MTIFFKIFLTIFIPFVMVTWLFKKAKLSDQHLDTAAKIVGAWGFVSFVTFLIAVIHLIWWVI